MNNETLAPEATHEELAYAQNEQRMAILKDGIAASDKFAELQANPLFQELILDRYIKDEGSNLVEMIAEPSFGSDEQQASIQRRLAGISSLQTFMRQYLQAGLTAKAELSQLEYMNDRIDQGMTMEAILAELQG